MKASKPMPAGLAVRDQRIDRALHRGRLEAARPKRRRVVDVYKELAERYQRIEPLYIEAVKLLAEIANRRDRLSRWEKVFVKKAMDKCADALPGRVEIAPKGGPLGWALIEKSD